MNTNPLTLLNSTRRVNFAAAFLLSLQFYGNLYEENGAIKNVVDPVPGDLTPALAAGSPLYFYMPWVLVGVALTIALLVKLRQHDFPRVRRDIWITLACIAVAAAAKALLVTQVNDIFRDPTVSSDHFVAAGWIWLLGNGIAIVASGTALWFLLRWRSRVPALIAHQPELPTSTAPKDEQAQISSS